MMMWRAFMGSPLRSLLFWVGFGILALIVATAFGQVLLNRWNQPFYDAIERRNVPDFLNQLMIFGYIAGGLLVLNIAQGWLNRYLHIKLREGLVRDLLDDWMRPGRALQPRSNPASSASTPTSACTRTPGTSPTSRPISASASRRRACCSRASSACCGRSRKASCSTTRATALPSPATWCGPALAYAGVASGISWLLGRPLIRLNADHYAREADMRAALVRASRRHRRHHQGERRGRGEGQAARRTSKP